MPLASTVSPMDAAKKRIHKRKWDALKARGITPPKDKAEEKKRLKAAHGY